MPITVLKEGVDVLTGPDRMFRYLGMFVGFRIRDAGTQPRPKIQESITNGVTDRSPTLQPLPTNRTHGTQTLIFSRILVPANLEPTSHFALQQCQQSHWQTAPSRVSTTRRKFML
jgi:hypothetical protein